jgi:hypothetical protein
MGLMTFRDGLNGAGNVCGCPLGADGVPGIGCAGGSGRGVPDFAGAAGTGVDGDARFGGNTGLGAGGITAGGVA